jgi:hypothetical protein
MGVRRTNTLKDDVWLWVEFLKLAHESDELCVKEALTRSKKRYKPWGNVVKTDFDEWWPEHRHMFHEQLVREIVWRSEMNEFDPEGREPIVYFEVKLEASRDTIVKQFRECLSEIMQSYMHREKYRNLGEYRFTGEVRVEPLATQMLLFRDVYWPNPRMRGDRLLQQMHDYCLREGIAIPNALRCDGPGDERALRNLRKLISRIHAIILEVAEGYFPKRPS